MGLDLDKCIAKVRQCEYLTEDELKELCEIVSGSHPPHLPPFPPAPRAQKDTRLGLRLPCAEDEDQD